MDASNKFYHIATVTNFMSKLLGKRCDDFQNQQLVPSVPSNRCVDNIYGICQTKPRLQNWNKVLESKSFLIQNNKIIKSLRQVS